MRHFKDNYQAPRIYEPDDIIEMENGREPKTAKVFGCMCGKEFCKKCETQTRCEKCLREMFGIEVRICKTFDKMLWASSASLKGEKYDTPDNIGCEMYFIVQINNLDQWTCSSCFEPPSKCTVGAIKELLAAADLLEQGFEVFRSMSPNASCDLIIHRNGRLWKIEVRTGRDGKREKVITNNKHRANVLAVVTPTRIMYDPPDFTKNEEVDEDPLS